MKTLGIIIGILALLAFVPLVHAEDVENETPSGEPLVIAPPVNETDLNESDASGFKPLIQELKVMFEPNQERKVQLELELARLRLIQAKIAAKHNNTAAMERAIEAHNRIMEKIRARIAAISNKGGNLTGLDRAIQVHELRIAKLNAILASENLTAEQKAKIEARIEHVENVTWKLQNVQAKLLNKTKENETEEENCTDSDGGKDYYVSSGFRSPCAANVPCGVFGEYCDGSRLHEEWCEDGQYKEEYYDCPNGCEDGACISNNTVTSSCGAKPCTSCGCGKK
jgi:hypothetical protein